jgi:hypothetical protein
MERQIQLLILIILVWYLRVELKMRWLSIGVVGLGILLIMQTRQIKEKFEEMIIPNSGPVNAVLRGYEECIYGNCYQSRNLIRNKIIVINDTLKTLERMQQTNAIIERINGLKQELNELEIKLDVLPGNFDSDRKDNIEIYKYALDELDLTLVQLQSMEQRNENLINETKQKIFNITNYFTQNPDKLLPASYDHRPFEEIGQLLKQIKETSLDPKKVDILTREFITSLKKINTDNTIGPKPEDLINPDTVNPDTVNTDISQIMFR